MKKFLILTVAAALCFNTSAFAAEGHGGAHWGYTGETGPEHWGKTFPDCNGKSQSPIDIVVADAAEKNLPAISFDYSQVPVQVVNNGHTIKADYVNDSKIEVGGQVFKLLQFHFHTPSENTVDGKFYPMEAHLVHQDANDKLGVVGVMFEEGAFNPVVEKIWRYMPAKANSKMLANDTVDANGMLPENKEYYSFEGSLTTPPCSEGVKWMVLKTPITASAEQIRKFERTMKHANNRPVQPLHGRVVAK